MQFGRTRALGALAAAMVAATSGAARSAPPQLNPPLEVKTLPAQRPGEHRVWIHDYAAGLYGRAILADADSGEWLGTVETGWEGIKLDVPRQSDKFYNLALFMTRGFHGERQDVLEIFDSRTLKLEGEVPVPPKMIRGWPNLNHSALTDDDRFLLIQFFTPASSVGVVDLRERKYVGEVETAGCAHTMAAGARRFFLLCGDGSALEVRLDESGREAARLAHKGLFDPHADPLHGTGVRQGDTWILVSHKGAVHRFDVSGDRFKALPAWTPPAAAGAPAVPAQIIQNIAVHRATNQLYMLMHRGSLEPKGGGVDYHRQYGTEVWVADLTNRTILRRMTLPRPTEAIAVSQDDKPHLYATTLGLTDVLVIDATSGAQLRTLEGGVTPLLMQPVEPAQ